MSLRRGDYRKLSERINVLKSDISNATVSSDRETSMVLTKLDEAEMWFNKIAVQ